MAQVPSWRPDVQGEADLVEEVARIASLTKLVGRPLPRVDAACAQADPVAGTARERRSRGGLWRAWAIMNASATALSIRPRPQPVRWWARMRRCWLENPISSDMSHMRPDLLAGLLQAAARNQARGFCRSGTVRGGPRLHRAASRASRSCRSQACWWDATAPRDPHGASSPRG
jgi:phenylalanyl-tRNA synthetase beta chain